MDEDDSPPRTPDIALLSQSTQNAQDDTTMHSSNLFPDTSKHLRAGSESGEKGLKRKFLERGTSQGPTENEESKHAPEPLKRARDESDKDDNPRETKRPSPPPSPPRRSPPPIAPKPVCSSWLHSVILYPDVFLERIYGIRIYQLPFCIGQGSKYFHVR